MRVVTMMVMLALGTGSAAAQTTMTPGSSPALGATSPLGIPGVMNPGAMNSGAPASPTGIPFGATQLNVGGLSPAPGPLAGSACSTVSGLASAGVFDGGGLGSGTNGSMDCGTASAATSTASSLVPPGSAGASTGGAGSIPLGATEIDGGGLSPLINSPAPDSGTTATPSLTPSP